MTKIIYFDLKSETYVSEYNLVNHKFEDTKEFRFLSQKELIKILALENLRIKRNQNLINLQYLSVMKN